MKAISLKFILVFLLFPLAASAQDLKPLLDKVEGMVKSNLADWKPIIRTIHSDDASYNWRLEDKSLNLFIKQTESKERAAVDLQSVLSGLSVRPREKIEGLGDESLLSISKGNGYCSIVFRKSNFLILLSAPSLAMGESLAREIAAMIESK